MTPRTRNGFRGKGEGRRGERGIALVAVLTVLFALVLIATPFAVSMRDQLQASYSLSQKARADMALEAVRAHATAALARGHASLDPTPDFDTLDEMVVDFTALDREFRDPRGVLASVRVEDEQGKINLNSATKGVLGNLLGVARLVRDVGAGDGFLPVDDPSRFNAEGGSVWVDGELIAYERAGGGGLSGCRRGERSQQGFLAARPHARGSIVHDARATEIVRWRLSSRPAAYSQFPTPTAIRSIADLGVAALSADEVKAILPQVTVDSTRLGAPPFGNPQPFIDPKLDPALLQLVTPDGSPVYLTSSRFLSPGTILRLRDGRSTFFTMVGDLQRHGEGGDGGARAQDQQSVDEMQKRIRERVSANRELSPQQIESRVQELTEYFTTAGLQGSVLGVLVGDVLPSELDLEFTVAETETPHPVNVNTASDAVLLAVLENLQLRGRDDFVTADDARRVIARIRKAPVTGWRHFLQEVLEPAREAGEISDEDLEAIYLNAQNPADIRLAFSTMPLCFRSGDVYTLDAAASVSSAAGVEQARATVREIVSIAPQKPLELTLATQQHFEDHIVSAAIGRWVETYPHHVGRYQGRTIPPSRYPQNRFERLFAAAETEDENGEEQGDVRLLVARREKQDNIEHFDRSVHNEGWKLDRPYRWNAISRLRADGGFLGSGTFRFWVRPVGGGGDRVLFDAGDPDGRNRITLRYDSRRSELVLSLADSAIEDRSNGIDDVVEVVYPTPLRDDTPYHVLAGFAGGKPGDLVLMLDGTAEKETPRLLTRLTTAIDQGSTPSSIDVEDAEGFPSRGTLLIGSEVFEYASRSNASFSLATNTTQTSQTSNDVAIGRGWRATRAEAYPAGASVELFGYANATTSRVPVGGATLGSNLAPFAVGELDSDNLIRTPVQLPWKGIEATAPEIPLTGPPGFMQAFGSRGYALIVDSLAALRVRIGNQAVVTIQLGCELIYYGGVQGNRLVNVKRGEPTPNNPRNAQTGLTTGKVHLNQNPGAPRRNLVVPISVEASGPALKRNYLDPMDVPNNLARSERIQIDDEWFRYDSIDDSEEFFLRDELAPILGALQNVVGSERERDETLPGGPSRRITGPGPSAALLQQGNDVSSAISNVLQFRNVDATAPASHAAGADITPCFRVHGAGVGPGDVVTLATAGSRQKEQHTVHWAAWNRPGGNGSYNYVSFQENVSREYPSIVEAWLIADRQAPSACPGRVRLEQQDSRGLTRLLKFPSGELPVRPPDFALIGAGVAGVSAGASGGRSAGPTSGFVDEIEGGVFRQGRAQQVARPLMLYRPPEAAQNTFVKSTDSEITLYRANARYTHSGILEPSFRADPNGSWTPSQDPGLPQDAGIVRIGQEWIAYRGLQTGTTTGVAPFATCSAPGPHSQTLQWIRLTDCVRGLFGSTPSNHGFESKAWFFEFLPITQLSTNVTAETASIPAVSRRGFLNEGLIGFIGLDGRIGELAHYVRLGPDSSFEIPVRRTQGGSIDGEAIFRGRFGTQATDHAAGDLVYDMPFRYWDRYRRECDRPEMSYFQATAEIPGAYFQSIEWDERLPKPFLDVKVLVRIDERASWDVEPLGEQNGLFLFEDPPSEKVVNRIAMRGDRIEVRVFFEYLPGAFNSAFTSDSWKETPWLRRLTVRYLAPHVVRRSEEAP